MIIIKPRQINDERIMDLSLFSPTRVQYCSTPRVHPTPPHLSLGNMSFVQLGVTRKILGMQELRPGGRVRRRERTDSINYAEGRITR